MILAILVTVMFLFTACSISDTSDSTDSGLSSKSSAKAICGNGIIETGETSDNCCLDIECPAFSSCKELNQGDKVVNACAKAKLEETDEFEKFMGYWEEESWEYSKEGDLINFDTILTKINQMNRSVAKLSEAYDTALLEAFVNYRYERREWNVNRGDLMEQMNKESDETKYKQLFSQIIELDKAELERLNAFDDAQLDEINDLFDYDIFERRDVLKSQIKEEEELLELANKEHEIELSVVDYNPTCYSYSDECFLDYVKVGIKNVGEIPLSNPTFDFYIMKLDSVKSRDIDTYAYDFDEIPVGYDGVYKETYVGYDSMDSLPPGSYTLKVNLKRGVSTKVIATASTSITLR